MVTALFDHHIAVNPDPVAVTDWVSGMTDRYALRAYHGACVTRIKDASVEDVRVGGRHGRSGIGQDRCCAARAGGLSVAARSTRNGQPRSRSIRSRRSTTASAAKRAATTSGSFRRPRASISSPRSNGWPIAMASSSSTRTAPPRRESPASNAIGCCGCSTTRRRSTPRFLWEHEAKPRPHVPTCTSGASPTRPPRHFGLAMRPERGTGCASRRLERDLPPPSSIVPASRCADGRGPVDRLRARVMFPLADPQGRVRGFGGRQMPGGEPPKYKNSPDGPAFRKERHRVRAR